MNIMNTENPHAQEELSAWPIHPTFLVKAIRKGSEKFSPNRDGIYDPDTIRGLLADSSDDLGIKNPLSLFQIVPGNVTFEELPYIQEIRPAENDRYLNNILEGKKIIRIDPKNLYGNKICCDMFRACSKECENKCHEQDCRIALLYHKELNGFNYTEDFQDYCRKLQEIIEEYNNGIPEKRYQLQLEPNVESKRLYVWYQCPYSNFREYFFPIVHSGKVIAVLMQGQRIPKGISQEDIFQDILKDNQINQKKKDALAQSIEDIPNEDYGKNPMSDDRVDAIWRRISMLERRINKKVLDYARTYVSDEFLNIENNFRKKIKEQIKCNKELTVDAYKQILNKVLCDICDKFNKGGFIRIYSTELEIDEEEFNIDTFRIIGASSDFKETEEQAWREFTFMNLPEDNLEEMQNEDFTPYLKQMPIFSKEEIFRIENLLVGNIKYLIWKKYPNKKGQDQSMFKVFSQFLKTFYHTLWEPFNVLRSVELRKKLETSMRVSVHETSQIIPVIISTLEKEYDIDTMTLIREDKLLSEMRIMQRRYTLLNTIQRLLLLDNLYKRSTLMFKELELNKVWIDLHQIVYSIKYMLSDSAMGNNMQTISINHNFNINKYNLFTDYQLINHTLFNLVDNAIKYGYMGSCIYINVTLPMLDLQYEEKGDVNSVKSIQISIVSYGQEIQKKDQLHLFELFYRPSSSRTKEGMGIGLFLVKKICHALGCSIEYQASKQPISEYNLPMYYHGKIQGQCPPSYKECADAIIEEVVNKKLSSKDWQINELEFNAAINQPTFRNEFIITLNKNDDNLIKEK